MRRWFGELNELMVGLVHPSARADRDLRPLHARFIATRLAAGGAALAAFPLVMAFQSVLPLALLVALLGCFAFIVAAALASRSGDVANGCIVSAAGLSLIASALWMSGLSLPALAFVWLLVAPLDCLLAGSRRALPGATAIAAVTAIFLVGGVTEKATAGAAFAALSGGWPSLAFFLPALLAAALLVDRALAENARLLSERNTEAGRVSAVLAALGDLVTTHDAAGGVLHAERGRASTLNFDSSNLAGQGLFEHIHVGDRPAILKCLSDTARNGAPAAATVRMCARPPGRGEAGAAPFHTMEVRAERLRGDGASAGRVVAVFNDVGERLAHEQAERALRLAAEQATYAKDRFLATVSHELRTPLNAIIGFAEVLSGEAMGHIHEAKRQEYAGIIHKSGNHLLEIVNALLDISKIESGKLDLQTEAFRLETLASSCIDIVHMRAEQAGIRVRADIETGLPEIHGDRRACRQVLVNLLSNAVKFTPAGGRITVTLRRAGDRIECAVDDSGIGISREDLPRLGDPFFQAADNLDRRFEGTGLGLSIVRGLVGLMGGSLFVESSPGQGTLVSVSIPIDGRLAEGRGNNAAIVTRPRGVKAASVLQPSVRKRA